MSCSVSGTCGTDVDYAYPAGNKLRYESGKGPTLVEKDQTNKKRAAAAEKLAKKYEKRADKARDLEPVSDSGEPPQLGRGKSGQAEYLKAKKLGPKPKK